MFDYATERVADAGRAPDGIVATLTVSLSCTGGAARENVVGGAGPVPNELSVCLSALNSVPKVSDG